MNLDALIRFYEELTLESISRLPEFYAQDAYFKDPFNEVRGLPAIERIFCHMFKQVSEPRFVVTDRVVDADGAVLIWEFSYRLRFWGRGEAQFMRGVSHFKFNGEGKVRYHRDYWDAAEELYMKLPGLGALMRGLKRALSA